MSVSTRVEVYDPANPDKPIARVIVPGELTKEQLRKELKVAVTLNIDLGEKKKKKTFPVKIFDEQLKKRLAEYVDNLIVKLIIVESEERTGGEFMLSEIKTE